MKTDLYDLEGKKVKTIELPLQFDTVYEPVLVKRAILVLENHQKQYGAMPEAFVGGLALGVPAGHLHYKKFLCFANRISPGQSRPLRLGADSRRRV